MSLKIGGRGGARSKSQQLRKLTWQNIGAAVIFHTRRLPEVNTRVLIQVRNGRGRRKTLDRVEGDQKLGRAGLVKSN